MRYSIYDLNEITDSKEILQSRPHKLTTFITYTIILIMASLILWSYLSEIDITVNSNGVVKSSGEITTVSNKVTGAVGSISYKDGDRIKQGDVIYTIEHESLIQQKNLMDKTLELKSLDLENLIKLRNSIADGENYFINSNDSDNKYLNIYKKYLLDSSSIIKDFQLNKNEIDSIQGKIINLNLLQKSINDNKNYFNDSSSFSNEYKDYELTIQQHKFKVNEAKQIYEKLKNAGGNHEDIERARENLNAIENDMNLYTNKTLLNIKTMIEQNNSKFKEIQENFMDNKYNSSEGTKLSALIQIDSDIDKLKYEINEMKNKLQIVNLSINDCIVRAPSSGIVKLTNVINKGDIIQTGFKLAEILPESSSKYKIELYIDQKDIGIIKKGQKLKMNFLAFPNKVYKNLESEIDSISQDSFINKDNGLSYYIAEATINNTELLKYNGKDVDIKLGMVCEVKVITDKKKVLYYILEKFDFINQKL